MNPDFIVNCIKRLNDQDSDGSRSIIFRYVIKL